MSTLEVNTIDTLSGTTDLTIGGSNNTGSTTIKTNNTNAVTIDSSQNLKFNSGFGSVATAYGCRAWVNFNGTGTPAIRQDGNVSSITDNGAGQYTINFTTSMPDTNYSAVSGGGGSGRNNTLTDVSFPDNLRAVGSIGVDTQYAHTTPFDAPFVCVAIFR
jgi:hypothetical protein